MMTKMINPFQDTNKYMVVSYSNKEEWRKNRVKGIGGSDVSCVLGTNPYKQGYQLYREKKGLDIAQDISDKPYVQYGTKAEHVIRQFMQLKNEHKYDYLYQENTQLISKEYEFMTYSPDGIIYDRENNRFGIWECKTSNILSSKSREKWENNTIPSNYYCQVLWGLAITEFEFVELDAELICVDKNGTEYSIFKHYHIERNEVLEDIEYIKQEVIKWWNEYFLQDKEPPVKFQL